MNSIASCKDPKWMHLVPYAQYNLGKAFYEGFGVPQSDEKAEYWWLLAAKDGDQDGCVKAQSTLAMFYSRLGENSYDMEKVCGSLPSIITHHSSDYLPQYTKTTTTTSIVAHHIQHNNPLQQ